MPFELGSDTLIMKVLQVNREERAEHEGVRVVKFAVILPTEV